MVAEVVGKKKKIHSENLKEKPQKRFKKIRVLRCRSRLSLLSREERTWWSEGGGGVRLEPELLK